jgi:hypothetical protein
VVPSKKAHRTFEEHLPPHSILRRGSAKQYGYTSEAKQQGAGADTSNRNSTISVAKEDNRWHTHATDSSPGGRRYVNFQAYAHSIMHVACSVSSFCSKLNLRFRLQSTGIRAREAITRTQCCCMVDIRNLMIDTFCAQKLVLQGQQRYHCTAERVKVVVRVRPPNPNETAGGVDITDDSTNITLQRK